MLKRTFLLILVTVALVSLLTACGDKNATTTPVTTTPIAQTTTTTPVATTTPLATETPTATQPADRVGTDMKVATKMSDLLYDIEAIQNYYGDGLSAMATFQVSKTSSIASNLNGKTVVFSSHITVKNAASNKGLKTGYSLQYTSMIVAGGVKKVPKEFMDKLPPSGAMKAPAGACPAAAEPQVTFKAKGGVAVTPELIAKKDIQTIPSELVTMAQNDRGSLVSLIESMVPMGDQSLATPQGWEKLLWSRLREMQQPAESLMDYQLWNASSEIMQQISSQYRERLVASGVPQIVLDAYDASASGDWYASSKPTEKDALSQMDIQAKMTGSIDGNVHELRDFSIPGASQTPKYGTQTGTGAVTWDHPELGLMNFDVKINLDKFDEEGRAIGGTTTGVDAERGYTIKFTFLSDGSKKGELLKDGQPAGLLTMTTNAEKFENYVDVKTNEKIAMPESTQTPVK